MSIDKVIHIDNVRLSDSGDSVIIIDQTKLPNIEEYIELKTPKDLYEAIYELKVRGAPAIGICAGYGLYVLARQISAENADIFLAKLTELKDYLNSSRPTAVNLSHALNRVEKAAIAVKEDGIEAMLSAMNEESCKIHTE
ncbi:MAG: S-methyl-5-thioribose-1-phosphate isomerase, partial [Ruminiclostridium sp.]|nr:S-methyl-5-thioribose-1-phosphate isomerase [Ruminiclostridium sp.]